MSVISKPVWNGVTVRERLLLIAVGVASIALRPIGYRGLFDVARVLGKLISASEFIVGIHPDVRLVVSTHDPYWLCYTPRGRRYEPEVEHVLSVFQDLPATFVDCGANLGYWSVLVSRCYGWRTIAIEAAPVTFGRLEQTMLLNGAAGIEAIHGAVSERSGGAVEIEYDALYHAGARVSAATVGPAPGRQSVPTVSVDDICPREGLLILKLDVEGHEKQALDGAEATLSRQCLLIYEEHGSQESCPVTRRLLDDGFSVFFLADAQCTSIRTAEEAKARLSRKSVGYNFAATKTPFISQRLAGHVGSWPPSTAVGGV